LGLIKIGSILALDTFAEILRKMIQTAAFEGADAPNSTKEGGK